MRPATTLTRAQAKRFYDRFGSRQDWQRFYEDRATTDLIRHGRFAEAHRTLCPKGALGVVSLTHGATAGARIVERAWMALHSRRPALVGGCRPIALEDYLNPARWRVRHDSVITQLAITSQVVVADRVGA